VAQQDIPKITGRNFIGGLIDGVNFPRGKKLPVLELLECNDIILVDRKYFLANKNLVEAWAEQYQC
jgi:hypothetical protein